MVLMQGEYLVFENIEFQNLLVKNITELHLLPDLPDKFKSDDYMIEKTVGDDFILEKKIEDDSYIEGLSYQLWETTDYWDILMLLNGMTRFDCLPANYDIVIKRADARLEEWKEISKLGTTVSQQNIDKKYEELILEEEIKNEKYRIIKYVSLSNLSEIIQAIAEAKASPKINKNLIINPI